MTTDDTEQLRDLIELWRACVHDVLSLLRDLDGTEWSAPTDLPGWDVRAVACHLAHLEAELAGPDGSRAESRELSEAKALTGDFTAAGVAARADRTPSQIVEELSGCADAWHARLRADPPTDASACPPGTPGGIGWDWGTLLRNRVVDLWMHEQDIRRAVGRPGGLAGPGAEHVVQTFAMAFPYCVGRRVAPPPGTTVVLDVAGVAPVHLAVEVGRDGRARPLPGDPGSPTATLSMDLETFIVLGGGRRDVTEVDVTCGDDVALARSVAASLAVTP